jgi:transposase
LGDIYARAQAARRQSYGALGRVCDLAREFERHLSPVMRQHHVAGDKVFVDYSGQKTSIVNLELKAQENLDIRWNGRNYLPSTSLNS